MIRNALLIVTAVLIALAGVVVARALSTSPPVPGVVASPGFGPVDPRAAARRLARALTYRTVSSADDRNAGAFELLHDHLQQSYPLVHQQLRLERINRLSLLFHWAGQNDALAPVILMAHQDVVPVGDEADWRYPPFSGTIADGAIWGRGAADDKTGVMAILEAVEGMLLAGVQPARSVYLAFGHDEEIGGVNGALAIASVLQERGVRAALVLDEGGVITAGKVPGIDGPVALVGIAEKGYLSLELASIQTGGHSSTPPPQTAVGIVAAAVTRLEADPFAARMVESTGLMLDHLAPLVPFSQRLVMANRWLFEPLIVHLFASRPESAAAVRTTTAATMFSGSNKDNVLPTLARAVVNFRILPGETVASVTERVIQVIDDDRVSVRPIGDSRDPSMRSDPDSAAFGLVSDAIRQAAGDDLAVLPFLMVGGTDARHFQSVGDQLLRFSSLELDHQELAAIHGIDERVRISKYAQTIHYYTLILSNLDRL